MGLFNYEEIELLKKAGINAESNIDYNLDERKRICMQVSEFIMSHSSKNGDIGRLQCEYSGILEKTISK